MIDFDPNAEPTIEELIRCSFGFYGLAIDEDGIEEYKARFDGVSDWFLAEAICDHVREDSINAPVHHFIINRINDKINYFASTTEH